MIKKSLACLLAMNFAFAEGVEDKFVIGTLPNEGFFSSFISVVSNLVWADEHHKTPVVNWDSRSLMYQSKGYNGAKNPWEYYFEPVSSATYDPKEAGVEVWSEGHAPDGSHLFLSFLREKEAFHNEAREKARDAITKYVKIKPSIQQKIDDFYSKNMAGKYTIGIHLRGTDISQNAKVKEGIAAASVKAAEEEAKNHGGEVQFFIASDDQSLFEYAKKRLSKPVIFCESRRSKDGKPLHRTGFEKAVLGEELLIEGVLLSKCDYFVHSHSSVPIAVMALNPRLETQFIDPMPFIYKYVYNLDN